MEIIVRAEEERDYRRVEEITKLAFSYPGRIERGQIGCPYEHWMVHELRNRDGIKELSLVAEVTRETETPEEVAEATGEIVGHIICSNAEVKAKEKTIKVLNFGPLSVHPKYQRRGVGKALIEAMIKKAKELDYGAILFFGREEYYPQFGFKEAATWDIYDVDGYNYPAFMGMELIPGYLKEAAGGRFFESDIYHDEQNREAVKAYDKEFETKRGRNKMYELLAIDELNLEEAMALCKQEYKEEFLKSDMMPKMDRELEGYLAGLVEAAKNAPYGKIMVEDGELIGFLAFFGPFEGFHGLAKGAFSPLGASAFGGKNKRKTASILVAAVMEEMLKDEVFSVAISRFANNEEVNRTLCLNSFGIRCSDAVMKLENYRFSKWNNNLIVRELNKDERSLTEQLYRVLEGHLAAGPCFMPTRHGQLQRWIEERTDRIFAAWDGPDMIGYIAIGVDGETYLTEKKDLFNISGAIVRNEYRGQGVAKQILDEVVRACITDGKKFLGVDCETINPTAIRFWPKYFHPYTYSFIRRLDERIYGYEVE